MYKLRFSLALLAWLGLSLWAWVPFVHAENVVGPTNLILCNKAASVTAVAAATGQAIAGVAGQAIQLCGWEVTSSQSAVTTFQFEYGTGASCTTPTTFTPALNITSTAPSVDRQQYAWSSIPSGATVCLVTTGTTVGIAAILYFAQF